MKAWKTWLSVPYCCDSCNGDVQVLTEEWLADIEFVDDGDLARCRLCYCIGYVVCEDEFYYIEWQDDPCAKCYREYVL
jgi:hypothetical protein